MSNKVKNPMKVITGPNTRWSYCNVWQPKSINGGTPKYSVSLIIPKSDTVTINKIKAAIEAAYKEGEAKLKGNGRSARTMKPTQTPTSSTPTAPRLRALWMRTASRSWILPRFTAVCTAGRASTFMRSIPMAIRGLPVA